MFFLGGINSILPYLIYLTLIWVFIIVGFNNKISSWLHFKEITPAEINNEYSNFDSTKEVGFFSYKEIQQTVKTSSPLIYKNQFSTGSLFYAYNDPLFLSDKINTDQYRAPPSVYSF